MDVLIEQEITATHATHATPINSTPFIEANTLPASLEEIRMSHIIPVFVKTNEPLISHSEFVEALVEATNEVLTGEQIREPEIRVSHPIKGRIPEAKDKPASELSDWEKTLYYERMAFVITIPGIRDTIDGNELCLTVGGVKTYGTDNLNSRSTAEQHFKAFIGFQNRVCTNMCVWTDGYSQDICASNVGQLHLSIRAMIEGYNLTAQLSRMKVLSELSITEPQFAHIIGRCRMYHHLPANLKATIAPLLFGDQQIGAVVRDYYRDRSFCRDGEGNINLWRLYNLLTGANKSSYIDTFLDRAVNASEFTEQIAQSVSGQLPSWYMP